MPVLHLDFETASGVDLKAVGVENYVRHPDFAVTVVAWAFDDGPVQSLVWPHTHLDSKVIAHIDAGGTIKAWNAAFEWAVLTHYYDWDVKPEQLDCVMQRASAWGLPMSLQDAGDALKLPIVKDMAARRLMLTMGKRRKDGTYWHHQTGPVGLEKLEELERYCVRDVEAERALDKVVPPLAKFERLVSVADAKINQKGVLVDLDAVKALKAAVVIEKECIDKECVALTGGAVTSPGTQTAKLMEWVALATHPGVLTDTTKAAVAHALTGYLPKDVRRVLELRQQAARASVAKLERMTGWASVWDGRARNLLQYYGAGRTGRWAGRGIQVQNLPRGKKGLKSDTVIRIAQQDPGALGLLYEDPLMNVSGALRGCLIPKPDHVLVSIDFSQIEARVLAWLAGQRDVVKAFADGTDVYTMQAAAVGSADRQLGKVLVLACGYGMGWLKFLQTAGENYGVVLTSQEAQQFHGDWRQNNQAIVQYWYALEKLVTLAVQRPGTEQWGDHGVAVRMRDGVLALRKPNGVKLSYHGMRLEDGGLVFDGVNSTSKKWGKERTYGGRLVENLVQSVARDVMAEGILAFPETLPVMTVHDEIVWEVAAFGSELAADMLRSGVETVPVWAAGLPLASDVKILRRYGK